MIRVLLLDGFWGGSLFCASPFALSGRATVVVRDEIVTWYAADREMTYFGFQRFLLPVPSNLA